MLPETKAWDGLVQLIDAPDLDGDGCREMVAVSEFDGRTPVTPSGAQPAEPKRLYVDVISGRDGHSFWWWHVDLPSTLHTRIWPARWWGRGPDGWPLLAVGLGGRLRRAPGDNTPSSLLHPPVTHLLELSTGREVHTIAGLTEPRSADLDGDGLADLQSTVRLHPTQGAIPPQARRR